MSNKVAREELIKLYGYRCFLLGVLNEHNPLTYHHIEPKKRATVKNGALLARFEHNLFNKVQEHKPRIADDVNCGFQEYKKTKSILLLAELRNEIIEEIYSLGYEIEDTGKLLVLKRVA